MLASRASARNRNKAIFDIVPMQKINGFFAQRIYNIHAAALVLGAAGLLSRLLGVLRDRLLAGRFGAGRELDIYYAAFQIPDFMAALFLLGAASAAILPIFQEYLHGDSRQAQNLIRELTSAFLFFAGAIALGVFFLAPLIVGLIAPGFSESERTLTLVLARVMLFSPIFFGLSGIASSVVQSHQRFFAYAAAPIFYNIGIIAGIVFFVPIWGVAGLGAGVVVGAFAHFLTLAATASTIGFGLGLSAVRLSPGVRRVVSLGLPRVLSISLSQITLLALVALGSTLAEGTISVLTLALNLFFVPIGIVGASYGTALFPSLSRAFLEKRPEEFARTFGAGVRTILLWVFPAAALFLVLRSHIVRVALGTGVFSWEDTQLTAAALAALVFSLWGGALIHLLIRAFYALENTWMPLAVNIFASLFTMGAAFGFVRVLTSDGFLRDALTVLFRIRGFSHPDVLGLALGFSLGMCLNAALLWFGVGRLARERLGAAIEIGWKNIIQMLVASVLAGGAAYGARVGLAQVLPLITFLQVLAQAVIAATAGAAVYITALGFLRNQDIMHVWGALCRRLFVRGVLPASWDGSEKV